MPEFHSMPRWNMYMPNLDYHGYEMRMLNVKKVTIVYAIVQETVQILYVWNNQQDPNRLAKRFHHLFRQ